MRRGDLLRHYRLHGPIDRGGMGVVWRAEDTRSSAMVVVKCIPATGLDADDAVHFRKRLRREARILLGLRHEAIVSEVEWFEEDGEIYLVLEYLEGTTMERWMKRNPPLAERLAVLRQVASAVAFAHGRGVVHRDLKPANVIVASDLRAKVLDFGLARAFDSTRLTHTGMFLGTIRYTAPEQARGERVDERADIFSLGVMFGEALGLEAPFRKSSTAVLDQLLSDRPVELDYWLPDDLKRCLRDLLAKDPAQRTPDATRVEKMIEVLLGEGDRLAARLTAAKASPAARVGPPVMGHVLRPEVTAALDAAVVQARASESGACVALLSTPGMGRSTELGSIAYRLRAGGLKVREVAFLEWALPRFVPWKLVEERLERRKEDETVAMPRGDAWESVVATFLDGAREEAKEGAGSAFVIDDVHLASPEDFGWLEALLEVTRQVPLVLALGCDIAAEGAGPTSYEAYDAFLARLAERPWVRRCHLKPLSDAAVREAMARGGAPQDAIEEITLASGGSPHLVNALLERWHDGQPVHAVLRAAPSPDLRRLERRFERLHEGLRRMLAAIAADGGRRPLAELASMLGVSELTARSRLHDLEVKHGLAAVKDGMALLTQPFLGAVATKP